MADSPDGNALLQEMLGTYPDPAEPAGDDGPDDAPAVPAASAQNRTTFPAASGAARTFRAITGRRD